MPVAAADLACVLRSKDFRRALGVKGMPERGEHTPDCEGGSSDPSGLLKPVGGQKDLSLR